MQAMAPIASAHHKHAAGRWNGEEGPDAGEPLPLEALGDEFEDGEYEPPAAMAWGGANQLLRAPGDVRRPEKTQLGLLQRLAELDRERESERGGGGRTSAASAGPLARRKRHHYEFSDGAPIRVRVLDVDALPLEELHRAFAFTLVRRLPAEVCVRVASRLAIFRDNFSHKAYENLIKDAGKLFGPTHGPELLALFTRCHATISVPFLLDYTRRYGTFSRKFIAAQVEQSLSPRLFDFVRYQDKGGVRPLPPVVSKPWALSSYTRLMGKSYLKSKLHEQLVLHGHVPKTQLEADMDENLPAEARAAERLSAAGALRVPGPVTSKDFRKQQQRPWRAEEADARRPALLDAIMEAECSGRGWDPADAQAVKAAAKTERVRARAIARANTVDAKSSTVAMLQEAEAADSDDDLEEELGLRADAGAGAGGERRSLESGEPEPMQGGASVGRFSMQFEHVVPDDALGASETALAELGGGGASGAGPGGGSGVRADRLELLDLPERFWTRMRRPFFRHMHKAYRLVEGQWQQVVDPRGPRHTPKRRHRPRPEKQEQRLRYKMRNAGPDA